MLCCVIPFYVSWFITASLLCSSAKHFWATWSSQNLLLWLCSIFGGIKNKQWDFYSTEILYNAVVGCCRPDKSQDKARARHESRLCHWRDLIWRVSGILNCADWYSVRPWAQQTWAHHLAMISVRHCHFTRQWGALSPVWAQSFGGEVLCQLPRQATNRSEQQNHKTEAEGNKEGWRTAVLNHSVYASTNTYATKYWMNMLAFGLFNSISSLAGISDRPIIFLATSFKRNYLIWAVSLSERVGWDRRSTNMCLYVSEWRRWESVCVQCIILCICVQNSMLKPFNSGRTRSWRTSQDAVQLSYSSSSSHTCTNVYKDADRHAHTHTYKQ